MDMYFGGFAATATTVTVLAQLGFVVYTMMNSRNVEKWGRRVLFLALFGLLICCFAATRDGYDKSVQAQFDSSVKAGLFTASSVQSVVCSIFGGIIALSSVSAIFVKNQKYRKAVFYIVSASFVIKALIIEISRWM